MRGLTLSMSLCAVISILDSEINHRKPSIRREGRVLDFRMANAEGVIENCQA